ncbi:LysR family transcriptional regulator [Coralliovum pocilloporae]|uniref:LysR family transcriptional regulator n=1 Tax=Coralliovum pocilloporae TaxID=3066369 RepID=UPI003306CA1E
MSIKLDMLRCFVQVAETGRLADAADRLGRTPSAISMTLKQLEAHLGAPLFESDRKSRLTPLGRLTLQEARRGVIHFDEVVHAIERQAKSETGLVRIATVPSAAEALLPQAVARFRETHPDVLVDIRDMDSRSVINELEQDRADLGIASGIIKRPGLMQRGLLNDAFGVICRRDHPLARDWAMLTWADMQDFPLIANALCSQIDDPDFQAILTRSTLTVHNTTSLLAMVRNGLGITVLPELVISPEDTILTFLPIANSTIRRDLTLLKRSGERLSPAAEAFEAVVG